jgi:hypothetical protein
MKLGKRLRTADYQDPPVRQQGGSMPMATIAEVTGLDEQAS